jgi:glutaminyl-peptide cyclotransferase
VRLVALALTSISILSLPGCKRAEATPNDDGKKPSSDLILVQNSSNTALPRERIWNDFNGNKALAEAKALVAFGPRPSGSEANIQVRAHLVERLNQLGWQTAEQRFTDHSPDGKPIEFCNLIARFSESPFSSKRVLIGAHFDTMPTQEFKAIGATDGAANCAILVELASVLASHPALASQVELLFLDGDAPFRELNLSDGLFGSRFYVQMLRIREHTDDVRAAILLRNTGDGALNYAPNGDGAVIEQLKTAAHVAGFNLEPDNRLLLGDQMPFLQAGIPSVALLDADSPVLNTADDTIERLNVDSLAKTGKTVLYFLATTATSQ